MFTSKQSVGKILEKMPIQKQSQFSTSDERDARPEYSTQRKCLKILEVYANDLFIADHSNGLSACLPVAQ